VATQLQLQKDIISYTKESGFTLVNEREGKEK
jgi:hypothetical protein